MSDETTASAHEREALSDETMALSHEREVLSDETTALAHEREAFSDETIALSHDRKALSDETMALSHEQEALSDETRALAHVQEELADETLAWLPSIKAVPAEAKARLRSERHCPHVEGPNSPNKDIIALLNKRPMVRHHRFRLSNGKRIQMTYGIARG